MNLIFAINYLIYFRFLALIQWSHLPLSPEFRRGKKDRGKNKRNKELDYLKLEY